MRAVIATPPQGDVSHRVGDIVRVDVVLESTRELRVNALAVALDYPAADLELVTGPTSLVPVPFTAAGMLVAPVLDLSTGAFGADATVFQNRHAVAVTTDGIVGQIDLDAGVALPASGQAVPVVVAPGSSAIVASAYLRVRRNPAGTTALAINLTGPVGSGERRSLVSDASTVASAGFNRLGRVVSGAITVAETRATLALAPATPVTGTVRRIGDLLPVVVTIDPTTALRNARTIRATLTFDTGDLLLVGIPSDGATTPPAPVAVGATGFASVAGSVLAGPGVPAVATVAYAVAGTTATVTLDLAGAPLALVAGTGPRVVATVYVRPRQRGTLTLALGGADVGVPATTGTSLAWSITTTATASATIANVRGTIGVGLAATVPAAVADGGAPPLLVGADALPVATGATVTDGRAVDVEVSVLAGATDVTGVDRFAVDIAYDASVLDIPTLPVVGTDVVLASGYVVDGSTLATVPTPGTVRLNVKPESSNSIEVPVAIARLRFVAKTQGGATVSTGTFTLAVGVGTDLRRAGSQSFASNLYDNGQDALAFDKLPTVIRQKPSSLTVETIVQGRALSDPDSRFVQSLRISLRRSGEAASPTRRYQPVVPASVFRTGTVPTESMRYLSTTTRKVGATQPTAMTTLPDLEPGTYDILVKGRSSVTVRLFGIVLAPGGAVVAPTGAAAAMTLPEGDADGSDAINGADFAVLARTFGTTGAEADFNQSGYVDAFDFALMARNYGLAGPVALGTLAVDTPLPTTVVAGSPATVRTVTLTVPPGLALERARVIVSGTAALPATCPATLPAGTTCLAETDARVRLEVIGDGGAGGGTPVTVGAFALAGVSAGNANLTVTLTDAVGHDPAASGTPITLRAAALSGVVAVDPSVTYRLVVVANGDGSVGASLALAVASGIHVTAGRATVAYDPATLVADGTCTGLPAGVSCDASSPGRVTFTIDPTAADLVGTTNIGLGTVRLAARPATNGTATVVGTVDDLADTVTTPGRRARLVTAPVGADADRVTVSVSGTGVSLPLTVSTASSSGAPVGSSTSSGRVRANGASGVTVPSIFMQSPTAGVAPGSIVPVTIEVATAGRSVDAMQAVVAVTPGFEVLGADGPIDGVTVPVVATEGSPWPVALRQRFDPANGRVELAFGRQVGPSVVGVVGDGAVGTIFLRVTDAAASGVALTVLPATRDGFTTGLATAESSVAFTAGSAIVRVDRTASVVNADLPTGVAPETGLEITTAPWPMPVAVTGVLPNIVNGTGSVSSGPRAVLGTAPVRAMPVGARAPRATANAGWREDVARGVIVLDLPGRASPVTVATGLATTAPDEWCAGPRYRTYLRLEDVGIAGATFGVGVGGVLDWVTPDRAGCVDWAAIGRDGLTVSKETVMQFRLAGVAPGALLWVVDGDRQGELYEVDAVGTATYVGAEAFAANQAHYREVWGNVIPVGTAQVEDLAGRGMVAR